jgi:hypothetical protein
MSDTGGGGKQAGSPEREVSRKPLAQGRPDDSAFTCCSFPVLLHARGPRVRRAPSLTRALQKQEGQRACIPRGDPPARMRMRALFRCLTVLNQKSMPGSRLSAAPCKRAISPATASPKIRPPLRLRRQLRMRLLDLAIARKHPLKTRVQGGRDIRSLLERRDQEAGRLDG